VRASAFLFVCHFLCGNDFLMLGEFPQREVFWLKLMMREIVVRRMMMMMMTMMTVMMVTLLIVTSTAMLKDGSYMIWESLHCMCCE